MTPPLNRRSFLALSGAAAAGALSAGADGYGPPPRPRPAGDGGPAGEDAEPVTLFLAGDVMTGRGVDQVLAHSNDPQIHEPWVNDARDYVRLAEAENGPIPAPVDDAWIWGEALAELDRVAPAARIVNLETAVSTHDQPWPGKGIQYRMHPGNVGCLIAADLDVCVLANNHVLDWSRPGLAETSTTLADAGIQAPGAGEDVEAAATPAAVALPGGRRLLVFSVGLGSSGIPAEWEATTDRSGVWRLPGLGDAAVDDVARRVRTARRPGDLVVLSIHWGGNWGWKIPGAHRDFARRVIDEAGVDLIHGHSSHHVMGVEIYRGRLILYGCGDLINDYEGISGHEGYRSELSLLYLPVLDAGSGRLLRLQGSPMRIRRFRLHGADQPEAVWLRDLLRRESSGVEVGLDADHRLFIEPV